MLLFFFNDMHDLYNSLNFTKTIWVPMESETAEEGEIPVTVAIVPTYCSGSGKRNQEKIWLFFFIWLVQQRTEKEL